MALRIVPADQAEWDDVKAVFGAKGPAYRCQCQRYRLAPRESFGKVPVEVRADRLRDQVEDGAGLVAYDGEGPVGWCAVAPRSSYDGLCRVYTVPWKGRDQDRADSSVWAVTCLLARAGHRRRGVGRALAAAAVDHARAAGASALEAYPILTTAVISEDLHVGTSEMYAAAGLVEVSRPTKRRAVMRLDL